METRESIEIGARCSFDLFTSLCCVVTLESNLRKRRYGGLLQYEDLLLPPGTRFPPDKASRRCYFVMNGVSGFYFHGKTRDARLFYPADSIISVIAHPCRPSHVTEHDGVHVLPCCAVLCMHNALYMHHARWRCSSLRINQEIITFSWYL